MSRRTAQRLTWNDRLHSDVLSHIQANAPITSAQLAERLNETAKAISVQIGILLSAGRIEAIDEHGKPIKTKGKTTPHYRPASLPTVATGPTAATHNTPWNGVCPGLNWAQSTLRPGCQDFLAVPSLRGQQRVPHRAPIAACVGKPLGPDEGGNRTRFQT